MVCFSGGKDSYVLLDVRLRCRKITVGSADRLSISTQAARFPCAVCRNPSLRAPCASASRADTSSVVKRLFRANLCSVVLASAARRAYRVESWARPRSRSVLLRRHPRDVFLNLFYGAS